MNSTSSKLPPRLQPHVQKILYVKNLPYGLNDGDYYDVFGEFGPIRQIRVGDTSERKGSAFVVYEDIYDAKTAYETLNGFNIQGRYLNVMYYNPQSRQKKQANEAYEYY